MALTSSLNISAAKIDFLLNKTTKNESKMMVKNTWKKPSKPIMDAVTLWTIVIITLLFILVTVFFVIRCMTQGKICQGRYRLDGKCVVITGADTTIGVELVREMCKRGANRVIMAVEDVELGQVGNFLSFSCQCFDTFLGQILVDFLNSSPQAPPSFQR
jgi:uncharacterized membrane protein